jgi:ACGX-repeat protein
MKGLHSLESWTDAGDYSARTSAQGYLGAGLSAKTGDKPKEPEPKPSACSSSCGAGDKPKQPEPKPSACGSSCGTGDAPKK